MAIRTKQQQIEAWNKVFQKIREKRNHPPEGVPPDRLTRIEREFRRLYDLDARDGLVPEREEAQPA